MISQICAAIIFLGMFIGIVSGKVARHILTTIAAACTLVVVFLLTMQSTQAVWEALNLHSLIQLEFWLPGQHGAVSSGGINWGTILFIAGMMIMVEGMGDTGFFRWICLVLAKWVRYRTTPLFLVFVFLSAVLSMFIDSITVILFLAAITIELAELLEFDPVPFILAEIFPLTWAGPLR